jgi:hypothetical protein
MIGVGPFMTTSNRRGDAAAAGRCSACMLGIRPLPLPTGGRPSPEGDLCELPGWTTNANAWMIENY